MIDPKDKAADLIGKYLTQHLTCGGIGMNTKQAIHAATICCTESINECVFWHGFGLYKEETDFARGKKRLEYLEQVLEAIKTFQ